MKYGSFKSLFALLYSICLTYYERRLFKSLFALLYSICLAYYERRLFKSLFVLLYSVYINMNLFICL